MFHLCLALGAPHPDHLGEVLTASQFFDWLEFLSVEPIGEERADIRAALVGANLAACWTNELGFEDFKINWYRSRGIQTAAQLEALSASINASFDRGNQQSGNQDRR